MFGNKAVENVIYPAYLHDDDGFPLQPEKTLERGKFIAFVSNWIPMAWCSNLSSIYSIKYMYIKIELALRYP